MYIIVTRLQYLYLFFISETKFTVRCLSIKYIILSVQIKLIFSKMQIFIKRQNVTITLELKKIYLLWGEEGDFTVLGYFSGGRYSLFYTGQETNLPSDLEGSLTLASKTVCSSHILEKVLWGMWQAMENCLPTNWPRTADPGSVPLRTPLHQAWWLLGPLEARTKFIPLVSCSI